MKSVTDTGMIDYDIEIDDEPCPSSGHGYTHRRPCDHCEDGFVNHFEEDPMWYDDKDVPCEECRGYGCFWWCPKCGYDMIRKRKPAGAGK